MPKLKKNKTEPVGLRVSERIFQRLQRDADDKEIAVATYVRQIVEEHYSLNERRTLKEITKQAENLLPDFKRQKKAMAQLIDKLDEYVEQSQVTEDYVAEMKSAEAFNMKMSREYFEKIIDRLDSISSSKAKEDPVKKPIRKEKKDVTDIELEDIKKTLMGKNDDAIAEEETADDLFKELTT